MANSKRLFYIDNAKAIMITLLLFHHYPSSYINPQISAQLRVWHEWFLVFFMPAFFLINGFCSNFDKPLKKFLVSNIKALALPATLMILINDIANAFGSDESISAIWRTFTNGATLWFLWSLFSGRIIHWLLRKRWMLYIPLSLVIVVVGVFLFINHIGANVFFYQNTFALTIFLLIGELLKKLSNKYDLRYIITMGSIVFVFSMTFLIWRKLPRPIVTGVIIINTMKEIPLFIWLATFGSLFVLGISSLLGKWRLLQSIGSHTLIIYGLHGLFFGHVFELANSFGWLSSTSLLIEYTVQILICIMTLLITYLFALLIDRIPVGKYIMGKW